MRTRILGFLRLCLGGAVWGSLLGSLLGSVLGSVYGAFQGDLALGLDGAVLGCLSVAILGSLYGAGVALRSTPFPGTAPGKFASRVASLAQAEVPRSRASRQVDALGS
jgi:hypothetical protein